MKKLLLLLFLIPNLVMGFCSASLYAGHFVLVRLIDFLYEIPTKRKMKRIDFELRY